MSDKMQKQNIGNAGEYYIAARLSALNFITTITLGRAEKYDLLAISQKGKLVKISVKTKRLESAYDFTLSAKDEIGQAKDFYYAFIRLNEFNKEPDFWIIPSKVVCPILARSHRRWKDTPGKNNREHGISNVRRLPTKLRGSDKLYYPRNLEVQMKKYYKNLKQLH